MTTPFIAAAYLLLIAQVPGQAPVHGLGGDVVPSRLQGLGQPPCQFDTSMDPRYPGHVRHLRHAPSNHLSIRWRRPYDRHRHRRGHFEDQP